MNKTLILLTLIALFFSGCSNSDIEPEDINYFMFEKIKYDIKDVGLVNDVKNGIYTIYITTGAELTDASYYGWALDLEGIGSRLKFELFTPFNNEDTLSTGRFEMNSVNLGKIVLTHASFIHNVEFSKGGYSSFSYSEEYRDLSSGFIQFEGINNTNDEKLIYDIEFNITIKQSTESDKSAQINGIYSGSIKYLEYIEQ